MPANLIPKDVIVALAAAPPGSTTAMAMPA